MYELSNVDTIQISLASPEKIREWSFGEVKKSDTLNYRTQKPEKDGLFCERIFGPVKDYRCSCGRLKGKHLAGSVCKTCGVTVMSKRARRERMGSIELATPVAHIWYSNGFSSPMVLLLDIKPKELEAVLYYDAYIVLDPKEVIELREKQVISDKDYMDLCDKYGDDAFRVGMGAEAIKELLMKIDIEAESKRLKEIIETKSGIERNRAIKRFEVVEAFRISGNKPEWMILDVVPVLPADLRPMVQLDGGRTSTTDINSLYYTLIVRNNNLKEYKEKAAPDVILRHQKRLIQSAVDALIANGKRGKPVNSPSGRPRKSLSDYIGGKQGRFRQNLLGKRVDYSGRSVIVVGPELKLYQCGLPKEMAIELFKPFVEHKLIAEGICTSADGASHYIEEGSGKVWEFLEEVIKDHPVLLNRAPTLHRLGIQAFEPVLVEGRAIKLHPLACTAFNADFDGDQMAVHVPLSLEAQAEARILMLCTNNILKLSDGKPVISPSQDIVMGSYYLTIIKPGAKGEGRIFASQDEAYHAYVEKEITLQSLIWVRVKGEDANGKPISKMLHTSIGRCIFNEKVPQDIHFVDRTNPDNILVPEIDGILGHNAFIDNKQLKEIVELAKGKEANEKLRQQILTVLRIDANMVQLNDIISEVNRFINKYGDIALFDDDNAKLTKELRTNIQEKLGCKAIAIGKNQLSKLVENCFKYHESTATAMVLDDIKTLGYKYSTIGAITASLFDMHIPALKKDLLDEADENVKKVEKNFNRGLLTEEERYNKVIKIWEAATKKVSQTVESTLDDFNPIMMMANSGARGKMEQINQLVGMRGLVRDPSGRTIELPIKTNYREGLSVLDYFNSSHGGRKGLADTALKTSDSGYLTRRLVDVAHAVVVSEQDCGDKKGIYVSEIRDDQNIIESLADRIDGRFTIDDIVDPYTGKVIAPADTMISPDQAKEIDEVLHKKWAEEGSDKKHYPKVLVRSVLNCKSVNGVCSKCYGKNMSSGRPVKIGEAVGIIAAQSIGEPGTQLTMRTFHSGGIASGEDITMGLPRVQELFEVRRPKGQAVIADRGGEVVDVKLDPHEITIKTGDNIKVYPLNYSAKVIVHKGDIVEDGQPLTAGNIYPQDLYAACQARSVQDYIVKEIQYIYHTSAGVNINDKHIEIIVRQMFKKVRIEDQGDSNFIPGTYADSSLVDKENERLLAEGKKPIQSKRLLLGIAKAALNSESFLSAASFQETSTILAKAAIKKTTDPLLGLKENVIVGKMIPAGTGMKCYKNISVAPSHTETHTGEGMEDLFKISTENSEEASAE